MHAPGIREIKRDNSEPRRPVRLRWSCFELDAHLVVVAHIPIAQIFEKESAVGVLAERTQLNHRSPKLTRASLDDPNECRCETSALEPRIDADPSVELLASLQERAGCDETTFAFHQPCVSFEIELEPPVPLIVDVPLGLAAHRTVIGCD
jgi:hypothetical protein